MEEKIEHLDDRSGSPEIKETLQETLIKLEKSISSLDERVRLQSSLSRNFLISLAKGFGSAAGATIIFGVISAFIIRYLMTIDFGPVIDNLLSSSKVIGGLMGFSENFQIDLKQFGF